MRTYDPYRHIHIIVDLELPVRELIQLRWALSEEGGHRISFSNNLSLPIWLRNVSGDVAPGQKREAWKGVLIEILPGDVVRMNGVEVDARSREWDELVAVALERAEDKTVLIVPAPDATCGRLIEICSATRRINVQVGLTLPHPEALYEILPTFVLFLA